MSLTAEISRSGRAGFTLFPRDKVVHLEFGLFRSCCGPRRDSPGMTMKSIDNQDKSTKSTASAAAAASAGSRQRVGGDRASRSDDRSGPRSAVRRRAAVDRRQPGQLAGRDAGLSRSAASGLAKEEVAALQAKVAELEQETSRSGSRRSGISARPFPSSAPSPSADWDPAAREDSMGAIGQNREIEQLKTLLFEQGRSACGRAGNGMSRRCGTMSAAPTAARGQQRQAS